MRAVLDTVVFVRALINQKGRWGRLLFELAERYTIVLSPEIIKEIISVLYRPALRERFPQMTAPARLDRVLQLFEEAEIVKPDETIAICRDADDNKFFACAIAGRAEVIVTEDSDILDVAEYRGVRPITAAAFMALLEDD